MEKKMAYRTYKSRFSDCSTLGDYDKVHKTITVVIPDDDKRVQRLPRVDCKVWKSYGAEWRLITAARPDGSPCGFVRRCEAGYWAVAHNLDRTFRDRQSALDWVLSKY